MRITKLLIEKILFYVLIFVLPLQTRIIFYQFSEPFNEWQGIYFYLTDILILAVIFFYYRGLTRISKLIYAETADKVLILFLIVSFFSLFGGLNFYLGFYQWLKLSELILLFFYIKHNLSKFGLGNIAKVFAASGIFQAFIAIVQFFNQSSLGLKFIEAGPLSPNIAGVAKIVVSGGAKMIRAYGTLPHPNVLAAFLVFCIFCLIYLFLEKSVSKKQLTAASGLLFFALFITFSRGIILISVIFSIILFIILLKQKKYPSQLKFLIPLFSTFYILFFIFLWPEISLWFRPEQFIESASLNLRVFYNQISLSIAAKNPFWGIGMGNFTEFLKENYRLDNWMYQPVHNIYLLIASETGLAGLLIFLYFIFLILKNGYQKLKKEKLLFTLRFHSGQVFYFLLFTFLTIGLFDHFFWTLQQGQLMFWILLGMISGLNNSKEFEN